MKTFLLFLILSSIYSEDSVHKIIKLAIKNNSYFSSQVDREKILSHLEGSHWLIVRPISLNLSRTSLNHSYRFLYEKINFRDYSLHLPSKFTEILIDKNDNLPIYTLGNISINSGKILKPKFPLIGIENDYLNSRNFYEFREYFYSVQINTINPNDNNIFLSILSENSLILNIQNIAYLCFKLNNKLFIKSIPYLNKKINSKDSIYEMNFNSFTGKWRIKQAISKFQEIDFNKELQNEYIYLKKNKIIFSEILISWFQKRIKKDSERNIFLQEVERETQINSIYLDITSFIEMTDKEGFLYEKNPFRNSLLKIFNGNEIFLMCSLKTDAEKETSFFYDRRFELYQNKKNELMIDTNFVFFILGRVE